jgi:hypothetical protein
MRQTIYWFVDDKLRAKVPAYRMADQSFRLCNMGRYWPERGEVLLKARFKPQRGRFVDRFTL